MSSDLFAALPALQREADRRGIPLRQAVREHLDALDHQEQAEAQARELDAVRQTIREVEECLVENGPSPALSRALVRFKRREAELLLPGK